ncbi:hypothetical protein CFP56_039860 [Quercus suber]|uniref:Uncharacterized protein n=1 Tax=Quercus suber TaxID=58331 RepID=A0AAW0LMB8_QUESU
METAEALQSQHKNLKLHESFEDHASASLKRNASSDEIQAVNIASERPLEMPYPTITKDSHNRTNTVCQKRSVVGSNPRPPDDGGLTNQVILTINLSALFAHTPYIGMNGTPGISDRADLNLWPLYTSDIDGFVIPSLEIGDLDQKVEASKPPSPKVSRKNPTLFITKDKGKNTLSVDYGNATGNMICGCSYGILPNAITHDYLPKSLKNPEEVPELLERISTNGSRMTAEC